MVAKQRIRMANEKHSKNITLRGNVAKSTVNHSFYLFGFYLGDYLMLNMISVLCLRYSKR